MFGIADCPEGMPTETGFKSYHKNRSYLCQSGRGGKFYFFAFMKNSQITVSQSIPRYTAEDEKVVINDYGADILRPGLTFGEIYKRRRHAVLVPVQEYVLDACFYKRAILIGDSFHKVCTMFLMKEVFLTEGYYSLTLSPDKVETLRLRTQLCWGIY